MKNGYKNETEELCNYNLQVNIFQFDYYIIMK